MSLTPNTSHVPRLDHIPAGTHALHAKWRAAAQAVMAHVREHGYMSPCVTELRIAERAAWDVFMRACGEVRVGWMTA